MKKSLFLLAVLACMTACIYPYKPDMEDAPEGILVVDGTLEIGETSTVQIGTMVSLWPKKKNPEENSDDVKYYTKAAYGQGLGVERVWAEDETGSVYEGSPLPPSRDPSDPSASWMTPYTLHTEEAPASRSYRVCVQADGRLYASDWIKPLAPPVIKKITFKSDKKDVRVNLSLDGGADATGYVLFSFEETWRFHTDWYPNYEYIPRTNTVEERTLPWDRYWCWKTENSFRQVPVDYSHMSASELREYPLHHFARTDSRNHQRYSILVKAKTIDKDTYRFLSHLEELDRSGDGLFTPNPGEIKGNLRCETEPERMVLGYVTVGTSTSRRVYCGSQYLIKQSPNAIDLAYPTQRPLMPGSPSWPDFYAMGYQPLIENHLEDGDTDKGPYGWGWPSCYDCVAAGGTLIAPDFWEN